MLPPLQNKRSLTALPCAGFQVRSSPHTLRFTAAGRIALDSLSQVARWLMRVAWVFNLTGMSEVLQILAAIDPCDPQVSEQLLPLVYRELRSLAVQWLAREKPGQTLQATALVHEAYLRLIGNDSNQPWNSRGHFFGAVAEAMRRILVEQARRKRST